ncbi:MAG: hypothetical protein QOG31_190 [Thermoplasmata archaeon]|nr:hypothetical protein [Thermoplasmata archaeon]
MGVVGVPFRNVYQRRARFPCMATPDPKVTAKRSDAGQDDKLAMLKELAKLTKPTGPSSQGRSDTAADE